MNEPCNWNVVLDRFSGRLDDIRELLTVFQTQMSQDRQAMASALDAQDADTVARIAHRIKGASGNFSADGMVQLARMLEDAAKQQQFDQIPSLADQLFCEAERLIRHIEQCALSSASFSNN
ncbi:MAG: Hpt domain-containing protein [Pirellulaceae bacterium]